MFPRIRLQHILFIIFTFVASLPVLFLAMWVQQSALDKEIATVEEKHLLVARNLTGDLARYVIDVESSLQLVSQNMMDSIEVGGLPEHLESLFLRYIIIAESNGEIKKQVTSISSSKIKKFESTTLNILFPRMKEAQSQPQTVIYSDLVRTGPDETTFYLIKALANNLYAIGALSTTHIIQAQKKVSFGRRGHAAIVDRTGRAIAHPVADWIKSMKDMSFLPPVKKMMQGKTGVSKFFTPAMQADMVAGYTTVPRSGWGVMVPQPFEELQERANDVQLIALMIALGGIAIAGMISWYISCVFSAPIQAVIDATEFDSDGSKSPLMAKVLASQRFAPHELRSLLTSFNEMRSNLNTLTSQLHSKIDLANEEVKSQNEQLQKQSQELQTTNKKLELLTFTDPLTSIFNRRHFDETLRQELAYARVQKDEFSLMMVDLDNFKKINDKYGHATGDKVLCEIAKVITDNVRKSDVVCRVGGEEFAIIFRHTNAHDIRVTAELLRNRVEQLVVKQYNEDITLTASIGMVTYSANSSDNFDQDDLYRHSDIAMYHSKKNGRNQTTHYADIADQ